MKGKRGLIMGVANDRSIAWGIAKAVHEQGAELAFTYQGEALKKRVAPLAESIGSKFVLPCDVSDLPSIDAVFGELEKALGLARLRRARDRLFQQGRTARAVRRYDRTTISR